MNRYRGIFNKVLEVFEIDEADNYRLHYCYCLPQGNFEIEFPCLSKTFLYCTLIFPELKSNIKGRINISFIFCSGQKQK